MNPTPDDIRTVLEFAQAVALPKLADLTPEQKRVMIAQACPNNVRCVRTPNISIWQYRGSEPTDEWGDCYRNDPLSDLNAMAGAEKVIFSHSVINDRSTPFHKYFFTLHGLCHMPDDRFNLPMESEHWAITAIASQRADAFLVAIGKAQL